MRAACVIIKPRTNLVVVVFLLHLFISVLPCAMAQINGQVRAPLPVVAEALNSGQLLSDGQLSALRDVVFQERRALVLLDRARVHLKENQLSQAFDALQTLLGDPQELLSPSQDWTRAPSDSFFLMGGRLRSVRHEALRMFESLTPDQLKFYEKKYSATAQSALEIARETGKATSYLEVSRRCFPTPAGAQAADEAATRLLDRGEASLAAKLWLGILQSNVHRNRLNPRLFEKAATALFFSGNDQQAQQVIQDAEAIFGTVQFSAASIEAIVRRHPESPGLALADGAGAPFGNRANNGTSQGSVPYLAPLWTQPLYGHRAFELLAAWERDRANTELEETGVAVFPIVVQNQLITRDLYGIRSCDPKTGRQLWRYNATLSVPDFVSRLREADPGRSTTLIEMAWAGNAAQGIVTSDGRRVFAIDWLDFEAAELGVGFGPGFPQPTLLRASNQLVCLDIPAQSNNDSESDDDEIRHVKPVWSVGGPTDPGALSDQLFLGAPRSVDDALFVMTESRRDRELNLVKLDAASGRVVWVQKLGLVERAGSRSDERHRNLPMALPAVADGTVICQPDTDIIVAVDASLGELKWIHAYGRDGPNGALSARSIGGTSNGFRGFPSTPLIHRRSVLCLPQHSEDILCLDLVTGDRVWKVKREDDYYLAAVTDGVLASIGKHGMRGLSLQDGSSVWSARVGLPSGRGTRIGNRYIIPLKEGGIASVELESGDWTRSSLVPALVQKRYLRSIQNTDGFLTAAREYNLAHFGIDDERVPDEVRPGNLVFHDGLVFSVGPQHLTAFPEVLTFLAERQQQAAQGQAVDELLVAQLELSADREDAAARRLSALLAMIESESTPTASELSTADRARWLLRQLIIDRLNREANSLSAGRRLEMIQQLQELSQRPQERQHALIERAQWEAENVSPASAVPFARQAIDTGLISFVPIKGNSDCLVTSDTRARHLLQQGLRSTSLSDRASLQDLIEQDLQVAVSLDTVDSLERFLRLYSAVAEAGAVRNRLADRLIRNGRFQAAELLLLQNRSHHDSSTRAVAEALLISLWSKLRLSYEAGAALYSFSKEFPKADLNAVLSDRLETVLAAISSREDSPDRTATAIGQSLMTGADFVSLFSGDESASKIFRDLHPLDWPVRQIRITQQSLGASNPLITSLWSNSPRRVTYSERSEFDIVRNANGLQNEWQILDRLAGTERGRIRMPARMTMPGPQGYRSVGHLMPIGTPAGMQTVSLLEMHDEQPLWTLQFPPLESNQILIEPGPATPSVCIFQTRRHLFGIEPATSRVLWRRSDLDLASGVFVDREAGLFGDESVLVMFHADQTHYTVIASQTGDVLREDELNVDFRYPHRVIGRKLFHVTLGTGNSGKRIRIWDPLTNEMELDEELVDRFYSAWSSDDELALMTTDSRLRVFSADRSKVIVDTQLTKEEIRYMSSLRVFSDEENVYVNLQRSEVTGDPDRIYSLASDSVIPMDNVHRGLLVALSRESGTILWKQPVQQRSFVRIDRGSLPFLVGLSRVSPKRNSSLRSLEVRVIDRMTGEDFVESVSLIQDRIVHYQLDRDAGELQLHGLVSRIDLGFSRLPKRIPLQEQPL